MPLHLTIGVPSLRSKENRCLCPGKHLLSVSVSEGYFGVRVAVDRELGNQVLTVKSNQVFTVEQFVMPAGGRH